MSKVLVIGYGNTLRGDDAAGVHAAGLIAKRHPEIICVCLHQLVPELAEQIAECDIVFFIDAQKDITQTNVRLVGIPASQFEFSEELSAQTDQAMHECVAVVEKYLTL